MKRIKFLAGYIFLVSAIIMSVGILSFAAEVEGSGVWINPRYNMNTVTFEKKLGSVKADKKADVPEYFDRAEEAVDYMRESMVNRQDVIYIRVAFDMDSLDENAFTDQNKYFLNSEWAYDTAYNLFLDACEHTGDGKEGDALMWNFGGYHYSYTHQTAGDILYFNCKYTMAYYTNAQQEAELDLAVDRVLEELNIYNGTNYEKTLAIYRYICDHVAYDYYNLERDPDYALMYTAYAALVNGTSVCQGYAVLFYRLALELGVDARFIGGETAGGGHAWNIVKIGSEYYNLDVTWDETASVGSYRYFLKGSDYFGYDHFRDEEYLTDDFLGEYYVPIYDFNSAYYNPVGEHVHFHILTSTANATCTVSGSKIYECVCGYSETETIEAFGHSMGDYTVTQQATCSVVGTESSECMRCSYKDTREIPKKAHTYTYSVVAPTCTQGGYTVHTCYYCQYKYNDAYTEKTGHRPVNISGVSPSCTSMGITSGIRCSLCSEYIVKQEYIPALSHKSDEGTVTSTATYFKKGRTVYRCTECRKNISEKTLPKKDIASILNTRISDIVNNSVTVYWNSVPNADKYIFYYGKDKNKLKSKTVKGTSAKISSFRRGDVYYYKIVAVSGKTKSEPSDVYYVIYTPSTPVISTLKADKKGRFTVKWSKAEGVSGYQLTYSTTSKFKKKTTKSVNIKKSSAVKKTVKKLSSGKKYFVKIRAYKTVSGKKVYGGYSKVKTVKIK